MKLTQALQSISTSLHQVALNACIERGIRLRQERALEQWTRTDTLDTLGPSLSSTVTRWLLYGTVVPSVHSSINQHRQYSSVHSTTSHNRHTVRRLPRRKMSSTESSAGDGGGGGGGGGSSSSTSSPKVPSPTRRTCGRRAREMHRTSTATSSYSSAGSITSILSSLSSVNSAGGGHQQQHSQRKQRRYERRTAKTAAGTAETKAGEINRRRTRKAMATKSNPDTRWTDESRSDSSEHSIEGPVCKHHRSSIFLVLLISFCLGASVALAILLLHFLLNALFLVIPFIDCYIFY
uniref:Uncharacterized protein n=1 Tax=Anopheles maculatus TaxID=74869 RepID=A0A182T2M8_9DIPT